MAQENASEADGAPRARLWQRRPLRIAAGALLSVLLLIGAALLWLDSQSGHRFIAEQLKKMTFENGMTIAVERIEGSIYGEMTLHEIAIGDPAGVFLTIPEATIDWRPFAYLGSHIDIRSLEVPLARLARLPAFKEVPSEGPLLPDIDIDVGRLELGRLDIAPAVTGERHWLRVAGNVHIADRRAQIEMQANAMVGPGVAGGDRLVLALDAVPEANRLDIDLSLTAPGDGLVAGFTGKAAPIRLWVRGAGDWASWDGQLNASYGSDELAGLLLTARDGTLAVRGDVQPGLLLTGTSASMLDQPTNIDLVATLEERRANLEGTVGNDKFSLSADGLVDLGENRFEDLVVDFRLSEPSAIAENMTGQGVAATLTLDGAFATPRIAYNLTAARLGFGETAIVGLRAQGDAKVDADQILLPIHARAARISGLNAAADQLLTNVRIDGDLAIQGPRILSDNLAIRSDGIDATAVLIADLSTGLYTGGINGRLGNYEVAGIGRFDVTSRLDLESDRGTFRISGTVSARSREIFNGTIHDFLGGNGLIAANVSYGADGVIRVARVRVAAPEFRLTDGSGTYNPEGGIRFEAQGISDSYGPLRVDVRGTVARPVAIVHAESPGFGIGLADVRAELRGIDRGYSLAATGQSDFGPLDAELTILSGSGPLTVDIARAQFAGVDFSGRITQSEAGPFTGTLDAAGSGITGQAQLLAAGEFQRVVITARARDAVLPSSAGVSIGRAIIDADLTLYEQPEIQADVQLAAFYMGDFDIDRARAQVEYRGGNGTAKLFALGSRGTNFRIALNAEMNPQQWRAALRGNAGGVGFRTVSPARIALSEGQYELLPTRLALREGSIQLAGRYGDDLVVQSRIAQLDLAILRPLFPNVGLGGTVSGSLDFEQQGNAFPQADARLTVNDFTRTGLASVSQPVDIKLVGRLLPDGGNMRVIFERRDIMIGRAQIDLAPLGPESGSWQTRLLAAPLSGGLRYNGPASALFSLAALPDQHLTGPVAVAADFSGRVQDPVLSGVVRADNLTYRNGSYGTELTNMRVRGTFTNDRLEVTELTAQAGDGTVSGAGFVSLSSERGYPIQLNLDLDNAQLADSQGMAARASGTVSIVNSPDQPAIIRGTIRLPETRYRIVRQGAAEVRTLSGVRRKMDAAQLARMQREAARAEPDAVSGLPSDWRLEVDVVAEDQVYVSGMGMESEWAADIRLRGTTGNPQILGGITLIRGTLGFAGRSFELEEGGSLRFNGGDPSNPALAVSAQGEVEDVTISINLSGSAGNPQITFSSTPALPQDEIMARILFGNSIGELSTIQAVQLASSLNTLRGGGGDLNPLGVLQSATGVDRLRILGADEDAGRGTSVAFGKYISNDIYVEIVTDARGFTATQIEISLTPALSVLSQVGSFGSSDVSLRYSKDY